MNKPYLAQVRVTLEQHGLLMLFLPTQKEGALPSTPLEAESSAVLCDKKGMFVVGGEEQHVHGASSNFCCKYLIVGPWAAECKSLWI